MNNSHGDYGSSHSSIKTTIKWFNPQKGFGFVVDPQGGRDIFLHNSVVMQSGHDRLPDGTTITCVLGQGPKGAEVKQILSVDTSTAQPSRDFGGSPRMGKRRFEDDGGARHQSAGAGEEASGIVKWYNSQKGFGFIIPDGGGRDVFVHMSALRRSGLHTLDEGQAVRMRVVQGNKGAEADTLEIV